MLWYWQAETPSSSVNPEPRVWHVWPYVTLHGVTSTQQRGTLTHIGVCLSYLHPSTSQLWHSSSHHQRSYCHTPIDTCPFWRNSDRYESWTFVLKNVRKCFVTAQNLLNDPAQVKWAHYKVCIFDRSIQWENTIVYNALIQFVHFLTLFTKDICLYILQRSLTSYTTYINHVRCHRCLCSCGLRVGGNRSTRRKPILWEASALPLRQPANNS